MIVVAVDPVHGDSAVASVPGRQTPVGKNRHSGDRPEFARTLALAADFPHKPPLRIELPDRHEVGVGHIQPATGPRRNRDDMGKRVFGRAGEGPDSDLLDKLGVARLRHASGPVREPLHHRRQAHRTCTERGQSKQSQRDPLHVEHSFLPIPGPKTPYNRNTPITCASTATAISSGVRAPIGNPIGPWIRSTSADENPAAPNRSRRAPCVLRLPSAPT